MLLGLFPNNQISAQSQFAVPQDERVVVDVEVSLAGEQVEAEEPVVSPTLADLKVGRELSNDVFRRIARRRQSRPTVRQTDDGGRRRRYGAGRSLVDHLDSVFVSGRSQTLEVETVTLI